LRIKDFLILQSSWLYEKKAIDLSILPHT
jgi:hypothetical protein